VESKIGRGRDRVRRALDRLHTIPRWLRTPAILLLDALVVSASFYLGFLLRFEGRLESGSYTLYARYLPLLLAIRLPLHFAFGIHRWSFRYSGFHEALRVALATLSGTACFASVFFFLRQPGLPRSVIAIEFFITSSLLVAFRFSPRAAQAWPLDTIGSRRGRVRTLVVGAGSAGDLLLRDLQRSDEHSYDVVGLVDDDPAKWGTTLGGRPVLGPLSALAELARRRGVQELLFAIPRLPASRLREVLSSCAPLKLRYKILPVSFAYLNDRVTASMLHELQPEDLLARSPARFDESEMRALIAGRCVLVTGAAGSIGSEICRQVAVHGPDRLVLVDINENDLYLLYRDLEQRFPDLKLAAEIGDIREKRRMLQIGRQYAPQDVFHAAAHKHVPLMEYSPEEAIKNNVSGCRNVMLMAEEAGSERFVLISTDKAVHPASVMGASKRMAELIVRDRADFATRPVFTAVRFGNVLGSAGSVVPLFKQQIAAGGPVTVTHPDCRRYMMTIPEAVGLVILAGLSGYGDLCILEMGEPMRILDLARLMITMAGGAPGEGVPIVFTGLRPGEKLDEELMTREEAEASQRLRDMIRVIDTPAPIPSVLARIRWIEELASNGKREALLRDIQTLFPTYSGPSVVEEPPVRHRAV
jgi:FlaA1/EpsC-like NDP-sugar epimerase